MQTATQQPLFPSHVGRLPDGSIRQHRSFDLASRKAASRKMTLELIPRGWSLRTIFEVDEGWRLIVERQVSEAEQLEALRVVRCMALSDDEHALERAVEKAQDLGLSEHEIRDARAGNEGV